MFVPKYMSTVLTPQSLPINYSISQVPIAAFDSLRHKVMETSLLNKSSIQVPYIVVSMCPIFRVDKAQGQHPGLSGSFRGMLQQVIPSHVFYASAVRVKVRGCKYADFIYLWLHSVTMCAFDMVMRIFSKD